MQRNEKYGPFGGWAEEIVYSSWAQMLNSANKDFKEAIINIFKELQENVVLIREQIGNLNREMETLKNQIE